MTDAPVSRKPGLSIAVCSFNRSALLGRALKSLSECQHPREPWQVIVVDNNSTDSTRETVDGFAHQLPITYVFESRQGLSYARNAALAACTSDILLFTDDDLRFDSDWISVYENAFDVAVDAGWFGGRVRPWWDQKRPRWLKDDKLALIAGLLVHYDLGSEDRAYTELDPTPFGASFALRRSVFESIGMFRVDLGVKGGVAGRGEETEYFERALAAGFRGWYVGRSSAWHWQNPDRFSMRYLYDYGIECGLAQRRIIGGSQPDSVGFIRELGFALRAVAQLMKGRGDRARQCLINMGIERGLRSAR